MEQNEELGDVADHPRWLYTLCTSVTVDAIDSSGVSYHCRKYSEISIYRDKCLKIELYGGLYSTLPLTASS